MPSPGGGRQKAGGAGADVMDVMAEIVALLGQAKMLPDAPAHMDMIQALEQGVIQIVTALRQQKIQQAVQGPQQPPGGGGMGGMGPGGPQGPGGAGGGAGPPGQAGQMPGLAQQIAPGGGAGMSGFGTPTDPDELRRTLAGPARAGVGS